MALSTPECAEIVQLAVVRSGGVNVRHPPSRTLHTAGLKATHQRASFQRHVARGVGEKGHLVDDVGNIPNGGSTTLAAVCQFIVSAATPIEAQP